MKTFITNKNSVSLLQTAVMSTVKSLHLKMFASHHTWREATPQQLPLLRGQQFHLLGEDELEETLAHCLYCNSLHSGPDSRRLHINRDHYQQHFG